MITSTTIQITTITLTASADSRSSRLRTENDSLKMLVAELTLRNRTLNFADR
jgi:hypothetical protein